RGTPHFDGRFLPLGNRKNARGLSSRQEGFGTVKRRQKPLMTTELIALSYLSPSQLRELKDACQSRIETFGTRIVFAGLVGVIAALLLDWRIALAWCVIAGGAQALDLEAAKRCITEIDTHPERRRYWLFVAVATFAVAAWAAIGLAFWTMGGPA